MEVEPSSRPRAAPPEVPAPRLRLPAEDESVSDWPTPLKKFRIAPAETETPEVASGVPAEPAILRRPPVTEVVPVYERTEPVRLSVPTPDLTREMLFSFVPVPPMAPT